MITMMRGLKNRAGAICEDCADYDSKSILKLMSYETKLL